MRHTPASLMLFAAGYGTRMRPLTDTLPKPLIEVAGKPLLTHAMEQVAHMPDLKVVANAHYKADQIVDYFAGTGVMVNREAPDLLDTGGGLRNALPLLGDGPVFTMNTDAVWNGPSALECLAQAWDPERMDALLLGVPPEHALGHAGQGDFSVDAEGRAARGPGLIYSGVQILQTKELLEIEDSVFSLNALWDRMIVRERLFILPYPGQWCDVGRPENIAMAEAMLRGEDV
ncbi:nucleotidyltransferase family protein [Pseudooceanicola spongiae]|uniref:NTP transferase domain-containing protein n=1 Tax=Pseudooceanicola spongiae TaxID=2613965 RepID=A0A7L9WNP6_9RHOB|nr:nucleotidyltransferase family protein [Pseudooceanicola spongiae]QOL82025.1 NTP transferase domain-containing protein [Pseudooceanicola spongiae]